MKLQLINTEAFNEGWGVFKNTPDATHNIYELQKLDELEIFNSDDEAIKYVVNKAIGNPKSIHSAAILFISRNSPNEMDSIIRTVIGEGKYTELKNSLKYENGFF